MNALKFTETHEWVKINDDGTAEVGITDHAQSLLGDLVYVNLPEEGAEFAAGDAFADVESVKASSEVFAPVGGTVAEINEELTDAPEKVNDDAMASWFVRLENVEGGDDLMTEEEYEKFLKTLDE